jgi:hypothetical protein
MQYGASFIYSLTTLRKLNYCYKHCATVERIKAAHLKNLFLNNVVLKYAKSS